MRQTLRQWTEVLGQNSYCYFPVSLEGGDVDVLPSQGTQPSRLTQAGGDKEFLSELRL